MISIPGGTFVCQTARGTETITCVERGNATCVGAWFWEIAERDGMTSLFQHKVRQVADRAQQLVRLYGVSWFVAVVCLVALAVGCLDYLVRFEDFGIRLIFSALFCLATAWGFGRFVVAAWRYRCSDLLAARRIEQYHPDLGDRLSSAVAFAQGPPDDQTAGSVELRRAVIAETETATQRIAFSHCINRRQPTRALLIAALAVATIGVLGLLDGPSVSLAARRLLAPWGDEHWPRRHVLQLVDAPTRLAVGQDFEVELIDANGRLPDRVEIHYWFDGDEASQIQTHQMQPLGSKLVHRLANLTRGFRYRATGGDDQTMPWMELLLVEPPKIVEKEMTLDPPDYTGLETGRAEGSFRALVGTRVTFRARTNKRLSAAMLETDTMGSVVSIRLSVDPDQRGFALSADAVQSWVLCCRVPTVFAWSTGTGWMSVSPITGTLTRSVICHLPCHSNVQPPTCLSRREPSCPSKRLSRMIWLFDRWTFISRGSR